jgi:hypothetical protein
MLKDNAMLKIMTPIFIIHLIYLYILSTTGSLNDLITPAISMFAFIFFTLPLFAFAVIGSIIILFTAKDKNK